MYPPPDENFEYYSLRTMQFAQYYERKNSLLLAGTGVRQFNSVACDFSSIKIHFPEYPKSLISRINEVYVFFQ